MAVKDGRSDRRAGTARTTVRRSVAGAAVLLVISLAACTSSTPDPADPTSTSTATGPTTPVPTQTGPTPVTPSPPAPSTYSGPPPATAPVVGATTLPPVASGAPAAFGDGLVATVTGVEETEADGNEPGDPSGPVAAVSITVENGTDAPVDLGGVTVTAAYGSDAQPATSVTGKPSAPARGVLAPGGSAKGVWAFAVPTAERSSLVVTISSVSSGTVVAVRV